MSDSKYVVDTVPLAAASLTRARDDIRAMIQTIEVRSPDLAELITHVYRCADFPPESAKEKGRVAAKHCADMQDHLVDIAKSVNVLRTALKAAMDAFEESRVKRDAQNRQGQKLTKG